MVNQAQAISLYQPVLQSIAYQMLGSLADAEDVVHDTFLKWLTIDPKTIENTKAYLVRAVTNNCINFLKKQKSTPDQHEIEAVPQSKLADPSQDSLLSGFDWETELSEALDVLHKKLEPLEKAVFVMRECFNMEYEELQTVFEKKKDHCRQIVSRAKAKLQKEAPSIQINLQLPTPGQYLDSFRQACNKGDVSELLGEFSREITDFIKSKTNNK